MEEDALDRTLREILDPLGVELQRHDGSHETEQATYHQEDEQQRSCVEVVCLYADEDERHWERLSEHFAILQDERLALRPCKLSKRYETFVDQLIGVLEQAHIVISLVSVDLLLALVRSDRRIQETLTCTARNETQAFASFAVVLRPCTWQEFRFIRESTILPANHRPIVLHRQRETAYMEVIKAIRTVMETFL